MFFNPQIYKRGLIFSLLFLGALLTSLCEPVPPEYKAFFSQDWDRQKEQANKFPIEKQIEYYLAGRKYVHPPSSTLLYIISQRGKAAIPALIERMKHEQRDGAKVDLLEVVRNIHDFHDDLSGDKELTEQLRKTVSDMHDPQQKTRAQELLTDIVENRRPPN